MARGRKKKTAIVDSGEVDKLENKIYDAPAILDKEVEAAFQIVKNEIHESDNSIQDFYYWDIPINEPIKFFDSNLSYEISGYRPINEKEGLDFDPSWFTEARETFLRTNHYCSYPRNSKAYADFWNREYLRCREGMTVNGYTITGDHYFFLNYY